MLGRNGYEWAYEETIVMETVDEAERAHAVFLKSLKDLDDYKEGRIKLDVYLNDEDLNKATSIILRLRQGWKSEHSVRFITDGENLGINIKPNKVLGDQVYYIHDDCE